MSIMICAINTKPISIFRKRIVIIRPIPIRIVKMKHRLLIPTAVEKLGKEIRLAIDKLYLMMMTI